MTRPCLLTLPWTGDRLQGFTSTRVGGVSQGDFDSLNLGLNTADAAEAVVENRRRCAERGGFPADRVVYLRQVHGEGIREALASDAGKGTLDWQASLPECDAVWTRVPGLPLAVGHADCLAVAMGDADAGLVGMAHAGWRGALAGLPAKLARVLIAEGAQARRLQVVLSPCLGPDSLELGEEQFHRFAAVFGHPEDFCSRLDQGHFFLDLWSCARRQLQEVGVLPLNLRAQEMDTARHPDLFYSHRRDQGKTGRMMTMVALK